MDTDDRDEILQHWGVKGMKWDKDKKKKEQDAIDNARMFDAKKKQEVTAEKEKERLSNTNHNLRLRNLYKRSDVEKKTMSKGEKIVSAINKAMYHNPKAEAKKTYDAMNKKLTITNEYEKKKLKERGDYSRTEAARKDVNDRNNKVKQTTKKISNAIAKAKNKIVGPKKEKPKAVITTTTNLFNWKPVKKRKSGRQK